MHSRKHAGKSVWIGAIAAAVAVLSLIIFFTVQAVPGEQQSIVLPSEGTVSDTHSQQIPSGSGDDQFVTVTNENVATVLQTLSRPAAYHQTYSVSVGREGKQGATQVELWVNSGLLHAEVAAGQQIRSLITDGTSVYLWYSDTPGYLTFELDEHLTVADILGLPDFDAYLHIPTEDVVDSGYLLLNEANVQCIYVSVRTSETQLVHHWVNLESGLLYKSDATENDKTVYSIQQTDFDLLAVEDETFSDRFTLPDGTVPFTVTTRTLQP